MTVTNNAPEVKAVIFDLDGTLLDTESLSDIANLDVLAPYLPNGLREKHKLLPWELKKQILGLRGSDWIPIVFKYTIQHWDASIPTISNKEEEIKNNYNSQQQQFCPKLINEYWMIWENRLSELCYDAKPCIGAENLVKELTKSGIPMGIATSSRADAVTKKRCNNEKIFKDIEIIVTGDDPAVCNGKPAPDIYIEAAKRMNVHPKDCLVFEDSLTGVQSGRRAGCYVIAVPDTRMDKDIFMNEAHDILADLSHFDARSYGIRF